MNQERLERIEFGHEYMDSKLLTSIEKFKSFDSNTNPVITVLCSDNRLLMQMEKLTDNSGNIKFHVCGTFNGIDDALEKARFSDAIIVNTLVLKISPDGLYKALKSIEELGKDVYFILSGWESLPKNSELCQKKLSQIDAEFPFAKIKASKSVFIKNLEGFYFIEDVMNDYINRIYNSFDFIHSVQVEALYKNMRNDIKKFREQVCIDIQKEQSLVLQLHQNMMAKQKRYEITFSHATVELNDTFERFEKLIKGLDIDMALCSLETEDMSAKERYLNNPGETEKEIKKAVYNKILSQMKSFNSSSLSSRNNLQIDEAMNDILSTAEMLKSCRFIDSFELEELEQSVRETSELFSNANDYNNSVSVILERVKEALRAKVIGFQFEKLTQNEIQKLISNMLSKSPNIVNKMHIGNTENQTAVEQEDTESTVKTGIKKLINLFPRKSDDENDKKRISSPSSYNDETSNEEMTDEGYEKTNDDYNDSEEDLNETDKLQEAEWNHFCLEVQRLIEYSKTALSALISDNCKIVNEEIDVQSKNSVTKYFSFIIENINRISEELREKLTEFGRIDL